jgi:hypothetical protein
MNSLAHARTRRANTAFTLRTEFKIKCEVRGLRFILSLFQIYRLPAPSLILWYNGWKPEGAAVASHRPINKRPHQQTRKNGWPTVSRNVTATLTWKWERISLLVIRHWSLPEPSDNKVRSWVPWDSETRITALASNGWMICEWWTGKD